MRKKKKKGYKYGIIWQVHNWQTLIDQKVCSRKKKGNTNWFSIKTSSKLEEILPTKWKRCLVIKETPRGPRCWKSCSRTSRSSINILRKWFPLVVPIFWNRFRFSSVQSHSRQTFWFCCICFEPIDNITKFLLQPEGKWRISIKSKWRNTATF